MRFMVLYCLVIQYPDLCHSPFSQIYPAFPKREQILSSSFQISIAWITRNQVSFSGLGFRERFNDSIIWSPISLVPRIFLGSVETSAISRVR